MSETGHSPTPETEPTATAPAPSAPQLAEALGVTADVLVQFVDTHPAPTAPILLGWAESTGDLARPPDALRADAAAWLDAHGRTAADRHGRGDRERYRALSENLRGEFL